jgi:hypothetical protein
MELNTYVQAGTSRMNLIFTAPVPFEPLEIHHNSRLVKVA